jgi:hypothetical protein
MKFSRGIRRIDIEKKSMFLKPSLLPSSRTEIMSDTERPHVAKIFRNPLDVRNVGLLLHIDAANRRGKFRFYVSK